MDRNSLLKSSRTKLMSIFNEVIEDVVHESVELFFQKTDKNSHARFVEVAPLFERAVQSLLESADLVDLTHSS